MVARSGVVLRLGRRAESVVRMGGGVLRNGLDLASLSFETSPR